MRWLSEIGRVGFFAALLIAMMMLVSVTFQPPAAQRVGPKPSEYSPEVMNAALASPNVLQWTEKIAAFGNRYAGTPGHAATQKFLEAFYRERGFEVIEFPVPTVVPVVDSCRLTVGGQEIAAAPFMPNYFQPDRTPPEGVKGTLLLVTEQVLLSEQSFEGKIAVLDIGSKLPAGMQMNAMNYLRLGFRGVIVTSSVPEVRWGGAKSMVTSMPVSFPRVYVGPEILNYLGQEATLDLRVGYQSRMVPTLAARLTATSVEARDAVVMGTHYDTYALLPWHQAPAMQTAQLAQHLALVDGISRYRGSLSRDVLVLASGGQFNALSGDSACLQMIGPALERWGGIAARIRENLAENESKLSVLEEGGDAWRDERMPAAILQGLYNKTQERLTARAQFEMLGTEDLNSPAFKRFTAANRASDRLRTLSSMSRERLDLPEHQKEILEFGIDKLLVADREKLIQYHRSQIEHLRAGVRLNEWASRYSNLFYLTSNLLPQEVNPGRESVTRLFGTLGNIFEKSNNSNGGTFREVASAVIIKDTYPEKLEVLEPNASLHSQFAMAPSAATLWSQFNYPAISFFNTDRRDSYLNYSNPFWPTGTPSSYEASLRYVGGFVLGLTHGLGTARPPQRLYGQWSYGGQVLVSGVGQSLVPTYALGGAVIGGKATVDNFQNGNGMYPLLMFQSDPYGKYQLEYVSAAISDGVYNLQAFGYDANGFIETAKDEGINTQRGFRSMELLYGQSVRHIPLVTFPARGVTVMDLINPQTLTPYSSVTFLARRGLSAQNKQNVFKNPEVVSVFLEPDQRFVMTFNAGSLDNELVQKVRAFALGPPEAESETDINGQGYFVIASPVLLDIYQQTAESMVRINGTRIALQERSNMLDPMSRDYFDESKRLLESSEGKVWLQRLLERWNSIAYSIMIHPILLSNIAQAITSIVWYLCLLVPFIFFIEKLVFGFTDIRRQLLAQSIIFLVSFLLLRLLHPAFDLIRSSIVILLGFVIFLICIGITLIFASKMAENLEPLRRKQGKVKAADSSAMGIMATAFMLGLNNMHRRKVRTGLTCGTLVLITFAMIAFTSIYQGYESREVALGPAAYQGLMIRKEKTAPIQASEISALLSKYSHRYPVYQRKAIVGRSSYLQEMVVPQLALVNLDPSSGRARTEAKTALFFEPKDPIQKLVRLLPGSRWIEDATPENPLAGVVISDQLAEKLGVHLPLPEGGTPVELNGNRVRVVGVFDSDALNDARDLDGRSLLPFDVDALQDFELVKGNFSILADDSAQSVPAEDVIIAPMGHAGKESGGAENRTISVVVAMEGVDFREATDTIQQFIEQTGEPVVYGLEDSAWRGVRRRSSSLEGMIDLIIPLILAAVTVLNTMKGSVYERRSELAVYNAVGIAPRYIFMMFFAEALVYAVVGSVLGYFLSQGVGATLTALDLTGGLNMTFASMNSIYASLAVVVAVFISTYFPAKTAVQIAAPAEDSGWRMPEPQGDELEFALPFVFDARERLAVLTFFRRYFSNFSEGEGGMFQSSEFHTVSQPIPGVGGTVWLKPFDQGVSQEIEILMPTDPETGEYCALVRMRRLSGTLESWTRLNRAFVGQLRRQFLHWRAVDAEEKEKLFGETREWFLSEAKA